MNYAKLYDNYLNAEHEVRAKEAGKDAVRRLQNATDTKRYGQYEPRRNQETFELTRGFFNYYDYRFVYPFIAGSE